MLHGSRPRLAGSFLSGPLSEQYWWVTEDQILFQENETDEDRIRKMFDDYVAAFCAGDANACGRFYAEDAEYVACGMAPVRGRSSIIALHEDLFRAGYELSSMETDELRLSGDLAYVRQTIRAGDGTSCAMLVLRREPGGDWLVHAEAEVTL